MHGGRCPQLRGMAAPRRAERLPTHSQRRGQHIELGIAENNLLLLMAAAGCAGSPARAARPPARWRMSFDAAVS